MNDVANFLKTFDDFHLARLESNLDMGIVRFSSPAMCLLGHHQDGYDRCVNTDIGSWAQHEMVVCVRDREEELFKDLQEFPTALGDHRLELLDRMRNEYLQPLVTSEIDFRKAGRIGSFAWKEEKS